MGPASNAGAMIFAIGLRPVAAKTDLESTASLSGNQDYRLRVP